MYSMATTYNHIIYSNKQLSNCRRNCPCYTHIVNILVDSCTHNNEAVGTSDGTKECKQQEAEVVSMPYAVVHPGTMVVHLHHASINKYHRC